MSFHDDPNSKVGAPGTTTEEPSVPEADLRPLELVPADSGFLGLGTSGNLLHPGTSSFSPQNFASLTKKAATLLLRSGHLHHL